MRRIDVPMVAALLAAAALTGCAGLPAATVSHSAPGTHAAAARRHVALRAVAASLSTPQSSTTSPTPDPTGHPVLQSSTAQCQAAARTYNGVLMIGDSIAASGFDEIVRSFSAAGRPLCLNAQAGRVTETGLDVLRSYYARGLVPRTVVMALGTNDTAATGQQMRCWIDRTAYLVNYYRDLYWVNVWRGSNLTGTRTVNQAIAEKAVQYANLADVNWYGMVQPYAWKFLPDGVHPTAAANAARTALITATVSAHPVYRAPLPQVSDCTAPLSRPGSA